MRCNGERNGPQRGEIRPARGNLVLIGTESGPASLDFGSIRPKLCDQTGEPREGRVRQ